MSNSEIQAVTRKRCYERDKYLCTNPYCPKRDEVKIVDGKKCWKNRFWDGERWRQKNLTLHHGLHRSEYFGDDRNEEWNLHTCCAHCHVIGGNDALHAGNTELDELFRDKSLRRKPNLEGLYAPRMAKKNEAVSKAMAERQKANREKRKKEYRNSVERFQAKHDGLTPWQFRYRQAKLARQQRENI